MSKYKAGNILTSFNFAFRGLMLALKSQRNFRADIIIGIIVLIAALWLKITRVEIAILVLIIGLTMFAELVNTVIEFIVDAYFGNKYSILAKMAKDISACAVMLCAGISVIIGILIFWPRVF
jgi:diacylglycerol kinase